MIVLAGGTIDVTGLERFADGLGGPAAYAYHINLDERGTFYADVRDASGKTVFEIKIDDGEPDCDHWNDGNIFEDGFMKHKHDMAGLKEYLVSLGHMRPNSILVDQATRRGASSLAVRPRTSRMVVCSNPVLLVGGTNDAHRAIFRDGFDPRDMTVVSYDPDEALAEPGFPADSRIALAAHVARCRMALASLSEDSGSPSAVELIANILGDGSPERGWATIRRYAVSQERRT